MTLPKGRVCMVCGKPGGTAFARLGYAHGGKCAKVAMAKLDKAIAKKDAIIAHLERRLQGGKP